MAGSRVYVGLLLATAGCGQLFGLDRVDPPIDAPARAPYEALVLADHPLAYFHLDETSGVSAIDVVAGGPVGTYAGNVTFGVAGAIAGDPDRAIALDGTNGAVDLGDVFDFAGLAPFSLEAWIDPTFDTDFHSILTKWHSPPANVGVELYYKDDRIVIARELGAADYLAYDGLVENAYAHVVATFDGAMMRLYLDGMERVRSDAMINVPDTTQPFLIGAGETLTGAPMLGPIDEVAIYGEALSAQQVNAHYEAGSQ